MQVSSMYVLAIRTSGPGWGEIHSEKENGGMMKFIPAISGFGQKSKGQLSFLGGLAQ